MPQLYLVKVQDLYVAVSPVTAQVSNTGNQKLATKFTKEKADALIERMKVRPGFSQCRRIKLKVKAA